MQRKTCCICANSFIPHRAVGDRQKTCGSPSCKKRHKQNANEQWRLNNPDYNRDDYPRVRTWLDQRPGYLTRYRHDHPEYVRKNRENQRRRDRQRRVRLDIQAKLSRQPADIMDHLTKVPPACDLDIQDEHILKPLEITFVLSRLAHMPCLDIQAEMDFLPHLRDNGAIKPGGDNYGCPLAHRP